MRNDQELINDLVDACRLVASYTAGATRESLAQNPMLRDALVRQIEIIGEATKVLSPSTRDAHPRVPWKEMAGMRDRLIHGYFEVDLDIVWTAAALRIPEVLAELEPFYAPEPRG